MEARLTHAINTYQYKNSSAIQTHQRSYTRAFARRISMIQSEILSQRSTRLTRSLAGRDQHGHRDPKYPGDNIEAEIFKRLRN